MNPLDRREQILRILKKIAPDTEPERLKDGDNIRQTLMIDSFDYLRFIVAVDKQFGINTPEEMYGKIGTLEKLLMYLQTKVS